MAGTPADGSFAASDGNLQGERGDGGEAGVLVLRGQKQGRQDVGHRHTALAHQAAVPQEDAAAHCEVGGTKSMCSFVTNVFQLPV